MGKPRCPECGAETTKDGIEEIRARCMGLQLDRAVHRDRADAAEARVRELEQEAKLNRAVMVAADQELGKRCERAERIAALEAEIAELREDKARLDWLDSTGKAICWGVDVNIRAAIDDAREEEG